VRVFVDALLEHMAPEPAWDGFLNLPRGVQAAGNTPADTSGKRRARAERASRRTRMRRR
jgi:hypothetical protein